MALSRVPAAFAALALFVSLASTARPVRATCMSGGSLAETYASADVVFVGRAASIAHVSLGVEKIGDREWEHVDRVVTFEVEEAFKGCEAGKPTVVSVGEDTSESLQIEEGREYVMSAARGEGGRLAAGGCGMSGPLEAGAATAAFCRHTARFGRPPSVVGRVGDDTPTDSAFRQHAEVPVAGVGVTLEGGGKRFEAVTDRDGGFVFADVPRGDYVAKLALPDGYRLTSLSTDGVEQKVGSSAVRVGKACAIVSAQATRGGAVTGRFLDAAGKPVVGYDLVLVPRDRLARLSPADVFALASTGDDGRFRLDPVAPGEYVLVANWPPMPSVDGPPRESFVVGKTATEPITYTVVAGRETPAGDLKAPETAAYVALDVEIVDEKGAPYDFALLTFADADGKPFGIKPLEEGGKARVYLPAGRPCSMTVRAGSGTPEPVAIDPAKVGPTLRVVVPR